MNREPGRTSDQREAGGADLVERASMDSFPASDPPSWIPGHLGHPTIPARKDDPSGKMRAPDIRMPESVRRSSKR